MALKSITKLLQIGVLACLALSTLLAVEQHGIVKFGGLPLPGATVTATQGDKKFEAVTDENGVYSFPDLADGIWNMKVEMLCFVTQTKEVAIAPDAPSPEWDMQLETVAQIKPVAPTAAAPPPAGAAASTAVAASGTAAAPSSGAASSAASASNSAAAPAAAAPASKGKSKKGKAAAQSAAANTPGGFQRADLNASSGAASLGADQSSAAPSEMSQSASDAFLVNGSVSNGIERRAIGNARRGPGSLYREDLVMTLDNSVLDATPFSIIGANTGRPAYNHLTLGATFGGPLNIPKLTHWAPNTGNFFFTYQIGRNRNASVQPGDMPTAADRSGNFSSIPQTVIDPTTGQPFPGNVIPQNRISPQAESLLSLYPQPNFLPTALYNYQIPIVAANNSQVFQVRVNRTLNRDNYLNFSTAYQGTNGKNPNLFNFVDGANSSGMNANLSWRHIFTRELTNVATYNFSHYSATTTPFFANKENIAGEAGITGDNQQPQNWGPPSLVFASGFSGLSDANQVLNRNQTDVVGDAFYWIRRPHNMTMGVDYRRVDANPLYQANPRGALTFTGAASGYDFADFLLGIPDTSSIAYGNADKYFRANWWDAYFNDDWRVSSGLTINGGLRWEYSSPITEKYGRLVNLDVTPGFGSVAPVLASNPVGSITGLKYPDSLLRPDKTGFEPNLGIAWHPFFGSSMLVRAGYSLRYNTSVYQSIATNMAQQSPLSKSLSMQNNPADPFTLANPFVGSPGTTSNTFAVDPNFRIGYAQNWQASVQQDLMEGIVMTVTYMGVKGTRGVQEFAPNTYPIGGVNPCPTCPSGFYYETSNGNSTREAGQLQVRRRFHAGFQASILYTYAKAIDDASLGGAGSARGGGGGAAVIAQNWLDLSAERGLSNFDQRHLATVQAQYSPGTGLHGGALLSGWRGAIFKDWTFVTTLNLGSGLPETPMYLAATPPTGFTGLIRPEYVGGSVTNAPAGRHLNPAAFIDPLPGQWGDAGRDSITGPSQFSLGGSMGRNFSTHLDFRFDATNILNTVTYTGWNTTINNTQFGLPLNANGMRTMQATLRWRF